jgi:hypothetical protein
MAGETKEAVKEAAFTVDRHSTEIATLADSQRAIADSQRAIAETLAKLNEPKGAPVENAHVEDNIFGKIADMKFVDIPIGAAAFGLLAGGVGDGISGLVQGMLPGNAAAQKYGPAAIKLGLAFVTAKYGKKLVGPTAANLGAFVFTMDAIQDIVDIRGMVSGLFPKKTVTTATTRAFSRPMMTSGATANPSGYYGGAFGHN